jgi:asparagine synthase (glutamine-hydrolysing)
MFLKVNLATGQASGGAVHGAGRPAGEGIRFAGYCRLDNRRDLLARLRLPPEVSDAELIVQAYLAFGEAHPERLLGDFGYALFDARERRLWLVRDHLGVAPLYYHRTDETCIAASSLNALLARPEIPRDLDDGVVAEWCVNGHVFNQTDTFHAAIKKLPRATQLCLNVNTTAGKRYWSLDSIEPIQENREPVLVEQLHDLLHTAILDRLGAEGGQGAHLSGGLDSTPIAIVAGRACRQRGQPFHTWNWCKPEPGDDRDCHEWTDARRVAHAEGFIHQETGVTPETLLQDLLQHNLARDGTTMFSYERRVLELAKAAGVSRIFSGFGGDEILTTRSRDRHHGALRAGRFLAVLRRMGLESDLRQRGALPRLVWRYARRLHHAWQPTPPYLYTWREEAKRRAAVRLSLLQSEFASFARNHLHELGGLNPADRLAEQQAEDINLGYHQERMESWAILGERQGVRHAYPFLDKRLVEFALALPGEWYYRRGQARYLYRRALGDSLPKPLQGKAKPPESERVGQMIENLRIAMLAPEVVERITGTASSYVDTQLLLRQLERLRQANRAPWHNKLLDVWVAFEAFLALNLGGYSQDGPA